MPADRSETGGARTRSWNTLAVSFATTLLVVGGTILAQTRRVAPGATGPVCVNTFTLTASTTNGFTWTSAPWSKSDTTSSDNFLPGKTQTTDCAVIGSGSGVEVNTNLNSLAQVTVQTGSFGPGFVNVPSDEALTVDNSGGGIVNNGNINLDSLSVLTLNSGSYSGSGNLGIKGGTFSNNVAALSMTGNVYLTGGEISGFGSIATTSGGASFYVTGATAPTRIAIPMSIDTYLGINNTTTHPLTLANSVNMNSGATLYVADGTVYQDVEGGGSISLNSGATFNTGTASRTRIR